MDSLNAEKLFVYGTLRKGLISPLSSLIEAYATYHQPGYFNGKLYTIDWYPGAVSTDPGDVVRGDLYSLTESYKVFTSLDEYESCTIKNPEFQREKVEIITEKGENVFSWIYIYSRPTKGLTLIPSGDYLSFIRKKKVLDRISSRMSFKK